MTRFMRKISFRFLEHWAWITYAMDRIGANRDEMWDTQDGFFYDVLHFPNGDAQRLKIRSMVGLLPLCATTVFEAEAFQNHPKILELIDLFRKRHPEIFKKLATADDSALGGYQGRRMAAVCNKDKLQRILRYMLDENEFLSPYGIRSLSKYHRDHPYVFYLEGREYHVDYLPAESNTGMFGGNSNWRGPIWMPVNGLIHSRSDAHVSLLRSRLQSRVSDRVGKLSDVIRSGEGNCWRLSKIFLQDASGKRPVTEARRNSRKIPTGRTTSCSTNISMAKMAQA